MKNKCKIIIIFLAIMTLTGCSKYEKDTSYTTDLYGTWIHNLDTVDETGLIYQLNETYKLNKDDTYNYTVYEIIGDEVTKDKSVEGQILSIEEISDDITKITLDQKYTSWSTGETYNETVYKYKNILGDFCETEVPKGKTFELHLDNVWFDKNGQYHICTDGDNCDCKEYCPQYIRKNNIIYFQSMDEEHKDYYSIGIYIVDDGLFFPELYKTE